MGRPEPESDLQRDLLTLIYERFLIGAKWEAFDSLDREFQRRFDHDIIEVARSMPDGLLRPPIRFAHQPPTDPLQLTLAGVSVVAESGGQPWDESVFLGAIRLAAEIELAWDGPNDDSGVPPTLPMLTADAVVERLWDRLALNQLPDMLADPLIRRAGYLLYGEPLGWKSAHRLGERDWTMTIGREIRPYARITNMHQYWERRDLYNSLQSPVQHVPNLVKDPAMAAPKVFISHASADREVADALKDTLQLGGLIAKDIFYSSDRTTGIATGSSLRSRLRDELQNAAIVIELLSNSFFNRPMCLMELGGAWALGKPTYPIVVPPVTYEAATGQIGEITMASVGSSEEISNMLYELPGILLQADPRLIVAFEPRHIDAFKAKLAVALTVYGRKSDGVTPSVVGRAPVVSTRVNAIAKLSPDEIGRSYIDGNLALQTERVRSTALGGSEVQGRITNNGTEKYSIIIVRATLSHNGTMVGSAMGTVSDLGPGASKVFQLDGDESAPDGSTVELQVDSKF